jgi:undecaprenyl-diphosphatase
MIRHLDEAVDRAFQPLRGNKIADRVFFVASEAADYSIAWHLISLLIAVVSPGRWRHTVRLALALGVESLVVNGGIKRLTRRPRPDLLENRAYQVRRPKTSSFPSGHASSAALAARLFNDAVPRLRPLWLALATTVSASRIHNRMHHVSDVAVGAILGSLFATAAKRLWPLR